jgi:hypothetical protein
MARHRQSPLDPPSRRFVPETLALVFRARNDVGRSGDSPFHFRFRGEILNTAFDSPVVDLLSSDDRRAFSALADTLSGSDASSDTGIVDPSSPTLDTALPDPVGDDPEVTRSAGAADFDLAFDKTSDIANRGKTSEQPSTLSPRLQRFKDHLPAMTPEQVAALHPAYLNLQDEQGQPMAAYLNAAQIQAVAPSALTAETVSKLSPSQIGAFTPAQLCALDRSGHVLLLDAALAMAHPASPRAS